MKVSVWAKPAAYVCVVVALDQVTKKLVLEKVGADESIGVVGPIHLVRRFNTGGAFSVGEHHGFFPWLVTGLVLALCAWFVRAIIRGDERLRGSSLLCICGIVGGALGNQIDRLFRGPGWNGGSVVDFIATFSFWPVFNIADAALTTGVLAILAKTVFDRQPQLQK